MIVVLVKNSHFVLKLVKDWNGEEMSSENMLMVAEDMIRLKKLMNDTIEAHCKTGLIF